MTIKRPLAKDQKHYNINKTILKNNLISKTYGKNTVCFFSHVPKTGGTSFESILAKNFTVSEVLHVNAPDLNRFPKLLELKKNKPKFICGHHPMHGLLYQLLPDTPLFHFTMLRDPVDRVISYYNYIKGKMDHPLHNHTADQTLTEFLNSNASPELSNGQTKRFSGHLHQQTANEATMLAEAQDTLKNCFSLVLTTCLYDQGLLLLKNRLGLKDIFYQRKNVSHRFVHREQLTNHELDLITKMNQLDIELFYGIKESCQQLIKTDVAAHHLKEFKTNQLSWLKLVES